MGLVTVLLCFLFASSSMELLSMTRRIEDRIRELCARALCESEPACSATIAELRAAIQQHALRVANLTATATLANQPDIICERRKG